MKTQNIIIEEPVDEEEFPLRKWRVEICLLDISGNEIPAEVLFSVTYNLHKSFQNPVRKLVEPPFALEEEGWGEFDMKIVCRFIKNGGLFTINHDLNFQDDAYAVDYTVHAPLHLPNFRNELAKYYPIAQYVTSDSEISEGKRGKDGRIRNPKSLSVSFRRWCFNIDEDVITKYTQLILNDPAIKNEINRHEVHEKVYLYFGQFPRELLEKMEEFMKNPPTESNDDIKTNSDDEFDIFEDEIDVP